MRAHRFRPIVDRLDGRIFLSDASAVAAVSPPMTQVVLSVTDMSVIGMMPGEDIDGIATWDWVVAGAPPAPTYDLSSPPCSGLVTSSDQSN